MASRPTGMIIDGVFASEALDSSGEVVSIRGMDITTMEEGQGTANYEHQNEDGGGMGRETVGKIVEVHKIFSKDDCETERHRFFFNKLKGIPFLYGVVRLYDGAGHEGAKALAAMIRDHVANDEPILVRFSIEGSTTKKEDNRIAESIAKRVALTLKPCNKTAISDLLEDPNAPEGFGKNELPEDPEFRKLGGSMEVECNLCVTEEDAAAARLMHNVHLVKGLRKALTAGSYDAAPSALAGGAALQREELHGDLRGTALAAIRDYTDKPFTRQGFKKFAKTKLPEVSDGFLDHFADIAEAYQIKKSVLAKGEAATGPDYAPGGHAVIEDLDDASDEPQLPGKAPRSAVQATWRGQPLKPNPGMVRPEFDSKKGVLHTPIGSFKAYLPKHDGPDADKNYQKILGDPKIDKAIDHAMENWSKVHKLMRGGKLPPEVVMHAVMFAQLSPNRAVPTQELQYARLVDAMNHTGYDPRYPQFENIRPYVHSLDKPDVPPETAREAVSTNPAYRVGNLPAPSYGPGGERVDVRGKKAKPSEMTGRFPGDFLPTRGLLDSSLDNIQRYHELHDGLVGLAQRHKHDMVGAVEELMDNKRRAKNHENVRRAAARDGRPDPGPNPHPSIPGLKVKTGLYTWGMLGGGNSAVPDTHFIRNAYGLDLTKDAKTLKYLKNLIWRETNMPRVMRPFNEWYARNHPAVQHTLNHPKWGSTFERPEDALFPSFWRHWLTIQPHERSLGMPNLAVQAETDHAPFWEAIRPHVDPLLRAERHDVTIPLRTALLHQQYVKDYGEVPAMFMYFHNIVPHLLDAAEHRERYGKDMQFLAKTRQLEAGLVELRKNVAAALGEVDHPKVHRVQLQVGERQHPAGRYMLHNGRVHHLEDYHGALDQFLPEGPINTETVSRLHGLKFAPHLDVAEHGAELPQEEKPTVMVDEPAAPQRAAVFHYHRPGMHEPHVVEFGEHGAALDGRHLDDAELGLMLSNVRDGVGTLRYKAGATTAMMKAEDMDPGDALQHIRDAVAQGHLPQDVERALTRHIYEDSMTGGIGNKYAYNRFRTNNKEGVYLSMDANDFKHVNDTYGHDAGDNAIKGLGTALRSASDKVGTGKLFRPGGDEFVAHFPTHEEAARFMRHAREHLDGIPPVAGVHKLSMSFGVGPSFEHADQALMQAKGQKIDPVSGGRLHQPGKVPHLAHSAMPGSEGPVSLHQETPPATALPAQQKPPAA